MPLTAIAFNKGLFGDFGQYIVAIGLLLLPSQRQFLGAITGVEATYLFGEICELLPHRLCSRVLWLPSLILQLSGPCWYCDCADTAEFDWNFLLRKT